MPAMRCKSSGEYAVHGCRDRCVDRYTSDIKTGSLITVAGTC